MQPELTLASCSQNLSKSLASKASQLSAASSILDVRLLSHFRATLPTREVAECLQTPTFVEKTRLRL